jgi:hypothetical protein
MELAVASGVEVAANALAALKDMTIDLRRLIVRVNVTENKSISIEHTSLGVSWVGGYL